MPKIGIMHSGTYGRSEHADSLSSFKKAVQRTFGSVTFDDGGGTNWAKNDLGQLPGIANRLLSDGTVNLVAALGGTACCDERIESPEQKYRIFYR